MTLKAVLNSFRVANQNRQLTFFDGSAETLATFLFQHGNCEWLVNILKTMLNLTPAIRDKHLFIVYNANSPEYQDINRTFAALDIKSDSSLWTVFKNIKDHPYEGSMEAFSKITNYGKFNNKGSIKI